MGRIDDFSQELSLASELVKNLAERADKDQNKEVSIEEILTFDDFEFIESALPVVLELGIPYNSVDYLVRLKLFNFFCNAIFCTNCLFAKNTYHNRYFLQIDNLCSLGESSFLWEANWTTGMQQGGG